ncbi:LysR family transcriptional regulator [Hyalangium versicolor]|uniref:LysR family transcriptional regulator n=1 Tax=Hyalangium versicolor TaxID=2861190 RepID=UPI001CCA3E38|nr:LysR family transcriptional regulator [Hyalangium versicolor]
MDRLETLRVFVAVAEESGFAAAARRLAMSPPAVTRAVSALEERLGTRLLHRTTRTVRLTDAGRQFLTDCKRILGELEEAEASAAGSQTELRGMLTVTASMMFGRMYVAPIVLDFLARHPQVVARTVLLDRVVDLLDEGVDVAVRIAHLPDSSLNAIRVGTVRRVVCASPRYLAEHGRPRTPAELSRFDAITFSQTASQQHGWSFTSGSKVQTVTPPSRLIVNATEVAIAAAVAGRGLTSVLSYQVASEVRRGQLQLVLEDYELPAIPIHIVHAEGRRANARVRAFVDFAVERLRAEESLKGQE